MEFQTRNEESEIKFFGSFKEAFEESIRDTTVWKISFTIPTNERIRLVRNQEGIFEYESIEFS